MQKKRLSKAIAAAGVGSRRACEKLIFEGRVRVNDQTIVLPQHHIDWDLDQIFVDGELLKQEEEKVYYMLNKPLGYLCSSVRYGKAPIVFDLFPNQKQRLFTIGRLDKMTSGLLLITNDGSFSNQVIHPSSNIVREYIVKVAQEITFDHLKTLAQGARVDKKWIRPIQLKKVRKGTFRISVKEGKKHEVRIIAERAGLKILTLCRIRIGSLVLGHLPVGKYRLLNRSDRELIFS